MKLKRFNENFKEDTIFKAKEELDNMNKEEIADFRLDLIKNHYNKDTKEYLEELEFYTDIRFVEDIYARYERWLRQHEVDINDTALRLVCDILKKKDGKNNLYYMGIISKLKKIGEFKYIQGVDINIPEKYRSLFKII